MNSNPTRPPNTKRLYATKSNQFRNTIAIICIIIDCKHSAGDLQT